MVWSVLLSAMDPVKDFQKEEGTDHVRQYPEGGDPDQDVQGLEVVAQAAVCPAETTVEMEFRKGAACLRRHPSDRNSPWRQIFSAIENLPI